jgi:predicted O-methyltransferase YrrM
MSRLSCFFAVMLSLFFMSFNLVHAQGDNASNYIQLIKAKKKKNKKQSPAPQTAPPSPPMPSQDNLPEPYRSVKLMPFNPEGWYVNSDQMESLFKQTKINVAIEVGCWLGLSTRHIATLLPPDGKLYAVDHWLGSIEHQDRLSLPTLYDQFLSNVIHAGLTHVIVPMKMSSLEAAPIIRSMGVVPDLVYIDASHDTESVLADLNAWFPFVKGHGILCGDDWTWGSVRTAVEIFAQEHQLKIDASENFWCLVE